MLSLNDLFEKKEKQYYLGLIYRKSIFSVIWIIRSKIHGKLVVNIRKDFLLEAEAISIDLERGNMIDIKTAILKMKQEILL